MRDNKVITECMSIIGYKRYRIAQVICSIVLDRQKITEEDISNAADARRTITRIMEIIKSQTDLSDKLKDLGFLDDCIEQEIAIDKLLTSIGTGAASIETPNMSKIKDIAER